MGDDVPFCILHFTFHNFYFTFLSMDGLSIRSLQLITVRWWNATAYYAVSLAQWLQKAGHPVWVAGNPDYPAQQKAQTLGIPTLPSLQLNRVSPWSILRNRALLAQTIREKRIAVVNAHRPDDHFYFSLLRNSFPELVLVRTIGDVRPPKAHPINKWLHLQATDFFIFSCRANLMRYREVWPIPEHRSAVIYSGIDTEAFSPTRNFMNLRRELNIPNDAIVFGLIARFSPVKGHAVFLKAATQLHRHHPEAYFLISGEEVEISLADLQQQAQQLGIRSHVRFLPRQQDVRPLLNTIDVGVVCSLGSEAISRIATEYLAMGKPVIATRVNVLPEMIQDEREGFIVLPGDTEALAARMETLLIHRELRLRMAQQARRTATERFDQHHILQQTLQVYQQVMEKKRGQT